MGANNLPSASHLGLLSETPCGYQEDLRWHMHARTHAGTTSEETRGREFPSYLVGYQETP